MNLRKIYITTALMAACLATFAAALQSDLSVSSTGRFGDPTGTARKYQDFLYGVIKEINPNELILSKTKFGVDQPFKLTKKTKFIQDNKPSSFNKLKVGDKIYVDADKDKKTGDLIAKKVVSGVDILSIPSEP